MMSGCSLITIFQTNYGWKRQKADERGTFNPPGLVNFVSYHPFDGFIIWVEQGGRMRQWHHWGQKFGNLLVNVNNTLLCHLPSEQKIPTARLSPHTVGITYLGSSVAFQKPCPFLRKYVQFWTQLPAAEITLWRSFGLTTQLLQLFPSNSLGPPIRIH